MRYRLNIAKNESVDVRIGTVVIKQNDSGKIVNVTVNQLGNATVLTQQGDDNNAPTITINQSTE